MNIMTQKAVYNDIDTILRFMKAYYKIERKEFHEEKSRSAITYLLMNEDIGSLWIIKHNSVAIGYYCLAYNYSLDIAGRDCFLDEIYIDTAYRGKGIGTEIMNHIITYLKKMKFKGMHLLVYNYNKPAYEFYCKNGFVEQDGKFLTRDI